MPRGACALLLIAAALEPPGGPALFVPPSAAQDASVVIAPSDGNGKPGDSGRTVAVTTGGAIVVGSTDLTLRFDPRRLQAENVESSLAHFTVRVDNEAGRIATASATAGPGSRLEAGARLLSIAFRVPASAPPGCSALELTDGDGRPPDDLGGPVPPIPPVSILYESRVGQFCVLACDDDSCTDEDHCTTDRCEPTEGCLHLEPSQADPASVTCRVTNLQDLLNGPPQPACAGDCFESLAKRLTKIERLIQRAAAAPRKRNCERKLKSAARAAKDLDKHIERLAKRDRFALPERAESMRAEARRLHQQSKSLLANRRDVCPSG